MSCRRCSYFAPTGSHVGLCTRNIEHVEVKRVHFCGEFKNQIKYSYSLGIITTVSEEDFQDMVKYLNDRNKSALENVKLGRENKELRKMYREATGKTAIIRNKP